MQVDSVTALLARAHTPLVMLAAGILLDNPWPQLRQVHTLPQRLQMGSLNAAPVQG